MAENPILNNCKIINLWYKKHLKKSFFKKKKPEMQASELSGLTLPANKDQIISHLCLTLISHINQIYKYYDKKLEVEGYCINF